MSKIKFIMLLMAVMIFLVNSEGKAMAKKPTSYYKERLEKIDFSDGINEEEAIVIAQNCIIDEGTQNRHLISKAKIEGERSLSGNRNCWIVWFPTTFTVRMRQGLKWGVVYVNKITGKVEGGGAGPDF